MCSKWKSLLFRRPIGSLSPGHLTRSFWWLPRIAQSSGEAQRSSQDTAASWALAHCWLLTPNWFLWPPLILLWSPENDNGLNLLISKWKEVYNHIHGSPQTHSWIQEWPWYKGRSSGHLAFCNHSQCHVACTKHFRTHLAGSASFSVHTRLLVCTLVF